MRKKVLISVLLSIIILIVFALTIFFMLYKTKYLKIVKQHSQTVNIENSLVLSIIKNESSFNERAVSSKGAKGLMQLTSSTAKEIAEKNNIVFNENDLFNPDINVKLGVFYLDYLFDMFSDKNLVIIAYNAGPFRVKNWLENGEVYDKNNKINTPFKETNAYLNKVIADQKVYKLLLKE